VKPCGINMQIFPFGLLPCAVADFVAKEAAQECHWRGHALLPSHSMLSKALVWQLDSLLRRTDDAFYFWH